jgi:hypothetical protein
VLFISPLVRRPPRLLAAWQTMPLRVPLVVLLLGQLQVVVAAGGSQPRRQRPPPPPSLPLHASDAFSVTVDGEPAFVYLAAVEAAQGRGVVNSSFVVLTLPAIGGGVQVQVTTLGANSSAPVKSAALRPRGSPPVVLHGGGALLCFSITTPGHYVLELDGAWAVDTLDAGLMVFVDAADPAPPSPSDSSVMYFGPGVHHVAGGLLTLASDTTTYLAPGAVVLAKVAATGVRNVTLRGGGILAAEWLPGDPLPFSCRHCGCPGSHGISIANASGVTVQGITLMHVNGWMFELESVVGARVSGIREIGWRCNNDGIDIVSSQDVVVEGCFIRSADDAIAVKGLNPTMDTRNVTVRDSILFPHGNCMEVGFELFNNFVQGVTFERNQCWHQMMSAMSVHDGGHATVTGLSYRDIIVEGLFAPPKQVPHDISYGYKLLDLQIIQSHYSGPDMNHRGAISNVLYSNISYRSNGLQWVRSRMAGNSSAHAVAGVRIEGFSINGTRVRSLADLGIIPSNQSFVRNVSFG